MQDELAEWLRHGATLLEVIVLKGEPLLPSIQSLTGIIPIWSTGK